MIKKEAKSTNKHDGIYKQNVGNENKKNMRNRKNSKDDRLLFKKYINCKAYKNYK